MEEQIKPETCEVCGGKDDYLYECDRCERVMCHDCQTPYNQFTQIDYNCCNDCAKYGHEDYDYE
jgi:protein-arginine kinase activator protein McsA